MPDDIFKPLNKTDLDPICKVLADSDPVLGTAYHKYGAPPLWDRPQGFSTLLQIILEQQVSLASAKACFDRLYARLGTVTPEGLVSLSDLELRTAGFSRQKASYARHLSEAIIQGQIELDRVAMMSDIEAKTELVKLKGVGEWTSDIYLLMALLRPDVMPRGDVALHTAWHQLSGEPRPTSDEFQSIAERWRPSRSVAARLLWHFYLSERSNRTT